MTSDKKGRVILTRAVFLVPCCLFLVPCLLPPAFAASSEDLQKAGALNESGIRKTKDRDLDGAENDLMQALVYSDQNPKIRKNLGVVYYEKGADHLQSKHNAQEARRYFQKALEIEPDNERYKKAYAGALFLAAASSVKEGRSEEALKLYEQAASYDPNNVVAWVQAAHYAWVNQKLDLAKKYFEKARAINPEDKNVQILGGRLSKSVPEQNLETRSSEHFVLSAGADYMKNVGSHNVLYDLEDAYNGVSYKLNIYPKNKIPVVFYPINDFRDHWRMPARVNALYDGKLRIPYTSNPAPASVFKPIFMHELTHAFVSLIAEKPIPHWLNEGLAQWVEGKSVDRRTKDALMNYEVARRVPDIAHLDAILAQQGNSFNNNDMTLAYIKSFSFVQYLAETYGIWGLVELVKECGHGNSVEGSFKKIFHTDLKEAEHSWILWLAKR